MPSNAYNGQKLKRPVNKGTTPTQAHAGPPLDQRHGEEHQTCGHFRCDALLLGRVPEDIALHLAVLAGYAAAGFQTALVLARRRLLR